MAILKYISVKTVIAEIYRDLNIDQEERWVDMVEWCAEALQKIGAFPQYHEKIAAITIDNYRGSLPCDIHEIIQLDINGRSVLSGTGTFDSQNDLPAKHSKHSVSYTINDSYINTNIENGEATIAYLAIPTDAEGFPLVPDDEGYKEAMEKYVVMRLKYPEFLAGTYNANIYMKLEKDWHKYCAQARGNANMPTIDELESIKNQWVRLMPQMQKHKDFFKTLNSGERIAGNKLPFNNRY